MRTRTKLTHGELEPGFRQMAKTFKRYLSCEEYLAAYVVAFSFLEDRIGAMHAVRCKNEALKPSRGAPFVEPASGQLQTRDEVCDENSLALPHGLVGGDAGEHRPGARSLVRGSTEWIRAAARREEIGEQSLVSATV